MRSLTAALVAVTLTAPAVAVPPWPWADLAPEDALEVRLDAPRAVGDRVAFDVVFTNRSGRTMTLLKPQSDPESGHDFAVLRWSSDTPGDRLDAPRRFPVARPLTADDFVALRADESFRLPGVGGPVEPPLLPGRAGNRRVSLEYSVFLPGDSPDPWVRRGAARVRPVRVRSAPLELTIPVLPDEVFARYRDADGPRKRYQRAVDILRIEKIVLDRCCGLLRDYENALRAVEIAECELAEAEVPYHDAVARLGIPFEPPPEPRP